MLEETIQTNAGSDVGTVANSEPVQGEIKFSPEDFDLSDLSTGDSKEQANPELIKIKYNGKDEEYSLDQLKELAQKGRNYDHVYQEKESLKNSEELKILSELAKQSGYKDTKEFVKAMKEVNEEKAFNERVSELERQGYDFEQAKYVAKLEKEKQATQSSVTQEESDPLVNDFSELFEAYPETRDIGEFEAYPQEFKDMVSAGAKPLVAYSKYLIQKEKLEKELALQNANAINRDSGSFKAGETDNKKDPFLEGLFTNK